MDLFRWIDDVFFSGAQMRSLRESYRKLCETFSDRGPRSIPSLDRAGCSTSDAVDQAYRDLIEIRERRAVALEEKCSALERTVRLQEAIIDVLRARLDDPELDANAWGEAGEEHVSWRFLTLADDIPPN